MFFGGPEFYHLVGDFKLSSLISHDLESLDDSQRIQQEEALQAARVLELQKVLLNRTKVFELEQEETFISVAQYEADLLRSKNFGPQLLEAVGFSYYNQASYWLEKHEGLFFKKW